MTSLPKSHTSTSGFDKTQEKDNSENLFDQGPTRRGDAGGVALSSEIDFPHKDYHDGPGKYDDDDENPSRAVEDAIPANPS